MMTLEKGLHFYSEVLKHVRDQDNMKRLPMERRYFVLSKSIAEEYGLTQGDQIAGYIMIEDGDYQSALNVTRGVAL